MGFPAIRSRLARRRGVTLLPIARSVLSFVFAALVVPAVLLSMVACSDDPDPNAPAAEPVLKVGEGQCLQVDQALPAEISSLPVIACDEMHTHEIFATVDEETSDLYPGLAALEDYAEPRCIDKFSDYVGISYFDSTLFITWIVPSLSGWNDEGDHEILCLLGLRGGGQLSKSAQDTGL